MMNKIEYFLSSGYLLTATTGTKFEIGYLILSVVMIALTIALRIFLKIKGGRVAVLKKFDRVWFWGYLTLGLVGIFVWFARSQALPLFSIRLVSYIWIILGVLLAVYIYYVFKSKAPKELSKFYEKKRKSKYLKG